MKDYEEKVLNIMDSAKDNIRIQLDKAYKSGYEDAKSELGQNAVDLAHEERDRAYQEGLQDAWEAAKKIVAIYKRPELLNMGFKCDGNDYNFSIIVEDYTAQDAIRMIKEYEKQQKQDAIQVGDEVQSCDIRYIVVKIRDNGTFEAIGACGTDEGLDLSKFHKTGRHFDAIAEVLAEMRGDSE